MILADLVETVNRRKREMVGPLKDELEAIENGIAEVSSKRQRYFDLYENDSIERDLFARRLDELGAELDGLHSRKSEIEYLLGDENTRPVSRGHVRAVLGMFASLLADSPPEQVKSLLHLAVRKITVKGIREIDKIELAFDESAQRHFLELAPSGDKPEGAFLCPEKLQSFYICI